MSLWKENVNKTDITVTHKQTKKQLSKTNPIN